MKEPSVIEQKAYRDTWGKGLDSYLKWFYETVVLLRELLADDGSIYVHLDWHIGHYAKAILDEVFGIDNFVNEIVTNRGRRKNLQTQFQRLTSLGTEHDVVFLYRKSSNIKYSFVKSAIRASDSQWQAFWRGNVERKTMQYELLGFQPTSGQFLWAKERALRAVKNYEDFIASGSNDIVEYWNNTGSVFEFVRQSPGRRYPEYWIPPKDEGVIGDVWTDIQAYSYSNGYSTEKHEDLLKRVMDMASNPGDLVLDCFCGSGTTAAVAEKLGRRWITCDLGRFAIHTARKRLLGIEGVKPFTVQNLGKYERQAWQAAEFGEERGPLAPNSGGTRVERLGEEGAASGAPTRPAPPELGAGGRSGYAERERSYRDFILDLYRAKPLHGYAWLHGVRNGRMVHVGGVDAPVSTQDVAQITAEFHRLTGTGKDAPTQSSVDILGWDFAFEINEVARQQAAGVGIDVHFVRIPREVLEKKAVEQGDIKFFELAALSVDVIESGRGVTLALRDFVIPLDDVPQEVQAAITHWEQWIDYWAVDWDNKGDAFHNQWQSYRTRKDKTLQRQIVSPPGTYKEPGEYKVVVKVIDILGNDTTKTVKVVIL